MLKIDNIHFGVRGLRIINGITLEVAAKETIGIIGPNGSGKTTLFNCISGFNGVDQGSIYLQGRPITGLSPARRAQSGLGRVFQNFGIFREMTVMENMQAALEARSPVWSTFLPWQKQVKVIKEQAIEYLKEVKLEAKAYERASSLSGGQMRLLEIIRTLAFGADVFLLDEPTAGVSPRMKEEVAHLIQKLQGLGKTVLVIEHDVNFIQKFCGRIVVLDGGKVVLDDTPDKVRNNKMLQEIYFGTDA